MRHTIEVKIFNKMWSMWEDTEVRVFENNRWTNVEEITLWKQRVAQPEPIEYENKEIGAYTTWYADPSDSVMLHYQTVDNSPVECLVRKLGSINWQPVELFADKPFPNTTKRVRWFKLQDLEPNTVYETKLARHKITYKFKTMPVAHLRDIKFAMTSDQMGYSNIFLDLANKAFNSMTTQNVDALILVGDIVHDDGIRHLSWEYWWREWFAFTKQNDGWLLPLVTVIGNHDGAIRNPDGSLINLLWVESGGTSDNIVFYHNFFANIDEVGYGVLDIGDYLSLVLLNSGHTANIKGTQTLWLKDRLQERQGRHILPLYHVNMYPLKYGYNGQYDTSKDMRENWAPLFIQYGVKVTGSGHDHMSLVTKRVSGDNLDSNGIVCVGNGYGLGTNLATSIYPLDTWFIDFIQDGTLNGSEMMGFDYFTFRQNGSVIIKKINFDGATMYQKTL